MPTSDHSTLGKPGTAESDAESEPLSGEQVLASAEDMVHGLLAAILSKDQKRQRLLLVAIGDLDEDGLGLQHAWEFLTSFRLRYVPTEGLAENAVIQLTVPPNDGLDEEAVRDWQAANVFATQLWTARAHLRTNPVAEVQVRMSLRTQPQAVRLLVLLVMAIAVSEMMADTADVQGRAFDYLDAIRRQFPEPNEIGPE